MYNIYYKFSYISLSFFEKMTRFKVLKKSFALLVFLFFGSGLHAQETAKSNIIDWSSAQNLPIEGGVNGAFIGVHNDVLILAGGANFPDQPVWEGGEKSWYGDIYVLEKKGGKTTWHKNLTKLHKPLAYGVSISTPEGVLCIGGSDSNGIYKEVFLLKWNESRKIVETESLPSLPIPLAYMSASVVGNVVYLVGGQEKVNGVSTSRFLSFDLNQNLTDTSTQWKVLPSFPGKGRINPVVVGQSNGHQDCLYVFSGTYHDPGSEMAYEMLHDVYEYDPRKSLWTQKRSVPNNLTPGLYGGYIAAAPSIALGDSHILIFGGAGGQNQHLYKRLELKRQIERLRLNDSSNVQIETLVSEEKKLVRGTSFSPTIWAYHTITDTWSKRGDLPDSTRVVTVALKWGDDIVIPSGEVRPGVRTPTVLMGALKPYKASFGWINYLTLIAYLAIMIFMGWYFSRRNKSTDDYFLAGGRIPWWAAGLSIYATMLSAITYLSQPAVAYSFDWQAYLGYFTILLIVPIVVIFYLPFFRKLNITTAYEYLEKRFNIAVRMFGSTSFVLFQLVRMGVVVYLPALAIATVVGMDIYLAITIMGILAILYTYMGGMEAVIWTDVVQVIVLMGGLILGLIFIAVEVGDVTYIFKTAYNDGKMQMLDLRFSFTEVVTWSLFLGSFALTLVNYTTDQAVVQRYMTTTDEKEARKSIWLNGIIAIPAGLLIFGMGAFLYVYFKEHPEFLTVGMQNDSVFPLFITNHLPPGVAGLVIAGIFSASMSSLDSSMHSVSTVVTVDYYKRFSNNYTEDRAFKLAKWTTIIVGVFGTLIACLMATFPVKSLFFLFQEVVGLFGSALAGVFILGIFFKRANWKGTLAGAMLSIMLLFIVKFNTPINFFIYPLIAIPVCIVTGLIFSYLMPTKGKNIDGLVYSAKK